MQSVRPVLAKLFLCAGDMLCPAADTSLIRRQLTVDRLEPVAKLNRQATAATIRQLRAAVRFSTLLADCVDSFVATAHKRGGVNEVAITRVTAAD